ncbi:MAG: hypothetical protein HKN93_00445, partial [Acidimicrobiia bacterium]|nr:hypothetical protein [Acidimicrobiia bacterium]
MLRLVTYIGLVLRRIWAKKAILVGSLLGATLVTALLVIVPLYESSVSAIDLVFTVQNAPSDRVDVVSRISTSDYTGSLGQANRDSVNARATVLAPFYPEVDERTLTREYIFIPLDGSVPWLDLAETWRADRADAITRIEEGELDIEVPTAPWPTPPFEATQARFFTAPEVTKWVELVEGEWPDARPPTVLTPMPIVIGEDLAQLTQLEVGEITVLRPFTGLIEVFELVEVVGIARALDPADVVWGTSDPARLMFLPQEVLDLWASPLPIANTEVAFDPWLREERGMTSMDADQRWFLPLDRDEIQLETKDAVSGAIANYKSELARESGIATDTSLPAILESFDVRAVVFGAPIFAMLALVVGGALYFLIYTASLTLEREGPELALLRTRGASAWQTVGIHLAQSLLIAAAAAFMAPVVARFLVGLTGRVPPLSDLTGGLPLRVAETDSLMPYILTGAVVTFVSMGLAVLPIARRSVLELRSLAGRPTSKSIWQRYNLDLFAISLAVVVLWVVASRGFIDTSGDETRLDPLAVVFPVLFLFATSLALLRVLPWLLWLVGFVMTKFRRLSWSLPGWHLGRNPVPYGRLALLVWLTTGFGAFALTYASTLDTSFEDRAAFTSGTDLRIEADGVGYASAPEGMPAAAVYRGEGAARQSASRQAELIAVVPDDFADVVAWRDDFGAENPEDIFSTLRPDGVAPSVGIELPSGTTEISVDGLVFPRAWA